MKQPLSIAIYQDQLVWNSPASNRQQIEKAWNDSGISADVFLLPETFTTGFNTTNTVVIEEAIGPTLMWMKAFSTKYQTSIAGSFFVEEGGATFNRFYWVNPGEQFFTYDKVHLYTPGNEAKICSPGHQKTIIQFKSWDVILSTCYDLRFPVWLRNQEEYDLMINVANWPRDRSEERKILLKARAIENCCFTVGVNIVGKNELGNRYTGESMIVGPDGIPKFETYDRRGIFKYTLEHSEIITRKKQLPFHLDADKFQLLPHNQSNDLKIS